MAGLTINATAKRELEAAIDEAVAGKNQKVVTRLARMLGLRHVPEVRKVQRLEVVQLPAPTPPPAATEPPRSYAGALPKPHRRHKEPDRVAEFRALYPSCTVLQCPNGPADPHHIWERGEGGGAGGGSDDFTNLLALCRPHHDEWHEPTMLREGFLAKYARRLPPVALLKIRLAAEMIAESKLGTREAIDLDAEEG